MKVYIQTQRLILRSTTEVDAPVLATLRSTDFVMKYNLYQPCNANDILQEMQFKEMLTILLKDEKTIIGCVCIKEDDMRYHVDSLDLEGWLSEEFAGFGYMSECFKAILKELFVVRMHARVTSKIFSENTACLRLIEKLGFIKEGFLRQAVKHPCGKIFDVVLYSMDQNEYKKTLG